MRQFVALVSLPADGGDFFYHYVEEVEADSRDEAFVYLRVRYMHKIGDIDNLLVSIFDEELFEYQRENGGWSDFLVGGCLPAFAVEE